MTRHTDLPFVPPHSYSQGRPYGPPRFLTVHYTAGAEGPRTAEAGAAYDQRRTDGTSAHYYVDSTGPVQCVDTANRAHTALWNGNNWGIHYELCGTVQTREQWLDTESRATIAQAGKIIARDAVDWHIPIVRIVGRQVRTLRGLCGHGDITVGFPEDHGSHTDPDGSHPGSFPWDVLLADVHANMPLLKPRVLIPKDIRQLGPTVPVKAWSDLHGHLNSWPISQGNGRMLNLLYVPATSFNKFTTANIGKYEYDGQIVNFLINLMRARGLDVPSTQYLLDQVVWDCLMRWKAEHNITASNSFDHTGEWGWSSWANVLGQRIG